MPNDLETGARLSAGDVRRLCGDLLDSQVSAIIASGASVADVEIAVARLTGADDMMRDQPVPLDGVAAAVYDLLLAGEDLPGEDGSGERSGG